MTSKMFGTSAALTVFDLLVILLTAVSFVVIDRGFLLIDFIWLLTFETVVWHSSSKGFVSASSIGSPSTSSSSGSSLSSSFSSSTSDSILSSSLIFV